MKNKDKYKTQKKARDAWKLVCDSHRFCSDCKYASRNFDEEMSCIFRWFYDEAEEETKEESKEDANEKQG
jgi:hypothetical protein